MFTLVHNDILIGYIGDEVHKYMIPESYKYTICPSQSFAKQIQEQSSLLVSYLWLCSFSTPDPLNTY